MIYIVTGMHRSGTSAVAGLLHHNGIWMGGPDTFYPRPLPENPKGFYENVLFRRINDAILEFNGYEVKSWDPNIPALTIPKWATDAAMNLIRNYTQHHCNWGFKDPRTCLTLDFWLSLIPDARVILVLRNPDHTARSMAKRGNCTIDQARELERVYMDRVYDSLRVCDVDWVPVRYDWLTHEDPGFQYMTAEILQEFLETDTDLDLSFIDSTLNHGKEANTDETA